MTYGALRLLISKANPGIDLELLDGYICDRYQNVILKGLSWKRLEGEIVLQAPPSYNVGLVTAIQGQAAIVNNGVGTWTQAMQGRMIRINAGQEYYQFNYVSATNALLDRPFEGTTSSITGSNIANGGASYIVGDQFWITGGNGLAQGSVEQVSASGAVLVYSLSNTGNNYSVENDVVCSGGSGAGLTLDITSVGGSQNLPYRIDQNLFVLPPEARVVRAVRPMHDRTRDLDIITPAELNRLAPQRTTYGVPRFAVASWDTDSEPPLMQVELYPVPASPSPTGNTLSWGIDYIYDAASLDPAATSATLLPWMNPAAIKSGVAADCAMFQEKIELAGAHESYFKGHVSQMLLTNAQQRGPTVIRIAEQFLGRKGPRWPGGPKRRGWPG